MNESNRDKLDAFLSQRRIRTEEATRIRDAGHAQALSARDRFLELITAVIKPTMAAVLQYVAGSEALEITEQWDQNTRQGTSTDAQISIHTGKADGGRLNPNSLSFAYRGGDKVVLHRRVAGANGGPGREIPLTSITPDLVETEVVEWLELIGGGGARQTPAVSTNSTALPDLAPA